MSILPPQFSALTRAVQVNADHTLTIKDPDRVRAAMDGLARASALGAGEERSTARWLIWALAQATGIYPASINELYMARGRYATRNDYTVPAMNLRALAYDSARAVFEAAVAHKVGAMIFELARSEMTYTDQRPAEYVASVLAAAIAAGYRGPVFIQGDHFQVSAKRYADDPDGEVNAVLDLAREAIAAGFYNIDVDTSTLVDLDLPTLAEQQRLNASLCAQITRHIRSLEPKGITVSVGGEIGEVGGKNSTEPELAAFMSEYSAALGGELVGLSKISVQTGTSHGGVVLPDGTLAQVKVDFDTLEYLSDVSRRRYGMAGAVQHGASTLPESAFRKFADSTACEVHLATNFQTMLFDRLPAAVRDEMHAWLLANKAGERKAGETDEQFLYKNRKFAVGPFKAALWNLDEAVKAEVRAAWRAQFAFLFEQLNVVNSAELVNNHIQPLAIGKAPHDFGASDALAEAVEGLAD
jgi:fructose/tagatose bisphosphate aldolase